MYIYRDISTNVGFYNCKIYRYAKKKKIKKQVKNITPLKKFQVLDQSHIYYITYYRSYKRTDTLINRLYIYYSYSLLSNQTRTFAKQIWYIVIKLFLTKLCLIKIVFISNIASNERMRGTECISFDFLYTDRNYIYINIIKYLKTKNILLKEMLFAQNKKHCISIIHSFFKKLFIQ